MTQKINERDVFALGWVHANPGCSSWDEAFQSEWRTRFGGGWNAGSNLERRLLSLFKAGRLTRKLSGHYRYTLAPVAKMAEDSR